MPTSYLFESRQIKSEQNPKDNSVISLDKKPVKTTKLNSKYVFTYKGEPVKEAKKSFKTTLKDSKIQDFRFHDLVDYVCKPGDFERRHIEECSRVFWA